MGFFDQENTRLETVWFSVLAALAGLCLPFGTCMGRRSPILAAKLVVRRETHKRGLILCSSFLGQGTEDFLVGLTWNAKDALFVSILRVYLICTCYVLPPISTHTHGTRTHALCVRELQPHLAPQGQPCHSRIPFSTAAVTLIYIRCT